RNLAPGRRAATRGAAPRTSAVPGPAQSAPARGRHRAPARTRSAEAGKPRSIPAPGLIQDDGQQTWKLASLLAERGPRPWRQRCAPAPKGLALFNALAAYGPEVVEVFPNASWTRWHRRRGPRTRAAWTRQGLAALGLKSAPARTNQDQRDAIAAAMTARQHSLVLTETMGNIVVPAGRW
ncbi:MAG: hypothetical protein WBF34_10890, partial [Streptosporangiaceae bacterium]